MYECVFERKRKGLGTASVHCPLSGDYMLMCYFNQVVSVGFPLICTHSTIFNHASRDFVYMHRKSIDMSLTILKTECVGVLGAWPWEPGLVGSRILLSPGELSLPTQPAPQVCGRVTWGAYFRSLHIDDRSYITMYTLLQLQNYLTEKRRPSL